MKKNRLFIISLFIVSWSCSPLIAPYDQYSYTQAINLKVDAMKLLGEANTLYTDHKAEAEQLLTNLEKIYAYESNIPKNDEAITAWKILKDTSGNSLGAIVVQWRKSKTIGSIELQSRAKYIGIDFDKIIKLEVTKIKK